MWFCCRFLYWSQDSLWGHCTNSWSKLFLTFMEIIIIIIIVTKIHKDDNYRLTWSFYIIFAYKCETYVFVPSKWVLVSKSLKNIEKHIVAHFCTFFAQLATFLSHLLLKLRQTTNHVTNKLFLIALCHKTLMAFIKLEI